MYFIGLEYFSAEENKNVILILGSMNMKANESVAFYRAPAKGLYAIGVRNGDDAQKICSKLHKINKKALEKLVRKAPKKFRQQVRDSYRYFPIRIYSTQLPFKAKSMPKDIRVPFITKITGEQSYFYKTM